MINQNIKGNLLFVNIILYKWSITWHCVNSPLNYKIGMFINLSWIMKSGNIWMSEGGMCSQPLVRIELKKGFYQMNRVLARLAEQVSKRSSFHRSCPVQDTHSILRTNILDIKHLICENCIFSDTLLFYYLLWVFLFIDF